ncbi:MAG: hypothetical protein AB8G15_05660 [Saprospiraceae bacterium]
MNRIILCGIFFSLLVSSACKKEEKEILWEAASINPERNIRNVLATDNELYVITNNEFYRLQANQELVERRKLNEGQPLLGRPALSENVFFRISKNQQNLERFEFHLTKNPNETTNILVSELPRNDDGEILLVEFNARNTGALNQEGTQLLLPVLSFPSYHYVFFLFDIELNATKDQFVSVSVSERIEAPQLPADFNNLVNTKYINGNYYVSSLNGGYRITPQGAIDQLFQTWTLDFFERNDKIYVTGYNAWEFFASEDNGINWTRIEGPQTELQMIEIANNKVFSHQGLGWPYQLVDDELKQTISMRYDGGLNNTPTGGYTNIAYFDGNYYIAHFKELFVSEQAITETE